VKVNMEYSKYLEVTITLEIRQVLTPAEARVVKTSVKVKGSGARKLIAAFDEAQKCVSDQFREETRSEVTERMRGPLIERETG
jgi:hypothetical protein